MLNNTLRAGAAGAASRYGSGSDQMMRFLAALASQHCLKFTLLFIIYEFLARFYCPSS
jgi:hypothetical protein